MSDFDAFEIIAAVLIAIIGGIQVILFAFFALKRLGRRRPTNGSRDRRTTDRQSSVRL